MEGEEGVGFREVGGGGGEAAILGMLVEAAICRQLDGSG